MEAHKKQPLSGIAAFAFGIAAEQAAMTYRNLFGDNAPVPVHPDPLHEHAIRIHADAPGLLTHDEGDVLFYDREEGEYCILIEHRPGEFAGTCYRRVGTVGEVKAVLTECGVMV